MDRIIKTVKQQLPSGPYCRFYLATTIAFLHAYDFILAGSREKFTPAGNLLPDADICQLVRTLQRLMPTGTRVRIDHWREIDAVMEHGMAQIGKSAAEVKQRADEAYAALQRDIGALTPDEITGYHMVAMLSPPIRAFPKALGIIRSRLDHIIREEAALVAAGRAN